MHATTMSSKLKVHVKVFVDNTLFNKAVMDLDESVMVKELKPLIFNKFQILSQNYNVQAMSVLDKKLDQFINVSDDHMLVPYDKFEIFLVKKLRDEKVAIGSSLPSAAIQNKYSSLSTPDVDKYKIIKCPGTINKRHPALIVKEAEMLEIHPETNEVIGRSGNYSSSGNSSQSNYVSTSPLRSIYVPQPPPSPSIYVHVSYVLRPEATSPPDEHCTAPFSTPDSESTK